MLKHNPISATISSVKYKNLNILSKYARIGRRTLRQPSAFQPNISLHSHAFHVPSDSLDSCFVFSKLFPRTGIVKKLEWMNNRSFFSGRTEKEKERQNVIDESVGLAACLIALPTGVYLSHYYLLNDDDREKFGELSIDLKARLKRNMDVYLPFIEWSTRKVEEYVDRLKSWWYEPQANGLLPPMLPPPYDRPITLVVNLEDILMGDSDKDFYPRKRAGVIFFLEYLSQYCELILTTKSSPAFLNDILPQIDPRGAISYHLTEDSLRYLNGKLVKDLNMYNRDLGRVVVLESDLNPDTLQTENCIFLPPWNQDPLDNSLLYLAGVIRQVAVFAFQNPSTDIRPLVAAIDRHTDLLKHTRGKSQQSNWLVSLGNMLFKSSAK